MTLTTNLYENSATVSTTEYSLANNSTSIATITTDGVFCLFVDFVNLAAGDEFEVALREKVIAGGTQRRYVLGNFVGVQASIYISPAFQLGHGWDFTITKIAGTDRSISWSVRAVT